MDSSKPTPIPLVKSIFFTIKQIRLYSEDHPMTQENLKTLELELLKYFETEKKLTLGAMRHRLLVDGSAVNDKESAAHDFAKEMEKMGVEGLIFSQGVDLDEMKKFLGVFSMRPKNLQEEGGFNVVFEKQGMMHIHLSKGKFQLVESGEIVVEKGAEVSSAEKDSTESDKPISTEGTAKKPFDIMQVIAQIQSDKISLSNHAENSVVFNAPEALKQLEKNPKDLVAAALSEVEDEVKLEQVIRNMSKVLVEGLLTFLVEQGKDVTKALEKLSKEIEKGIATLGDEEAYEDLKKKVPEIFEEATDELRVQMVRKTYEKNPDDIKAVEKIAKKLFKDKDVRARLEPYLKEETSDAGLEASQIESIFNTLDKQEAKKKNKVSVDASELKELKKKAAFYDSMSDGTLDKKIQNLELENKIVRHQKERMDSVIHNLAEGLVVVDENGEVVLMNPAAERLLDVTQGQKLGQSISEGLGEGTMISVSQGNLRDDTSGTQQVQLLGQNEETKKILQASSAVIENEDGQTVGMVSVLSDITKQKQVDELKSKFVSNVSHELRTPLVAIQKSLSLILEKEVGEITEDQEKFLSIAHRNIDRLSRLINDLLDVQKLDAGQMRIVPSLFPINGVVDHVISTMGTWLKDKKITIEKKYSSAPIDVEADPDRLTQVVTNLLGNAVKYTPDEGVIVVDIIESVNDKTVCEGSCVEIAVQDSGIGIAEEDLKKVFEKFIQVGLTQPAGVSSTGLGLTITKEIVELHGGKIWVESKEKEGSRFAFRIPQKFISKES